MIKLGIRHSFFYPTILIVCDFLRKIDSDLLDYLCKYNDSFLFTTIMFFSEMIFGLIISKYQSQFYKQKTQKKYDNYKGIELITTNDDSKIPIRNSVLKIILIIFTIVLVDYFQFSIPTFFFNDYLSDDIISKTLTIRLTSIITLFSALLYVLLFKRDIRRHQKCSLIVISFCLIIILISEFLIIKKISDYMKSLGLIVAIHFCHSVIASLEKYLMEYYSINPFKMLMFEGFYGLILSFITFIVLFVFFPEKLSIGKITKNNYLLIILFLIFFFLLSGGRNSYKQFTNKIFSPMTLSLNYCILNPLLLIYYFLTNRDKIIKDNYFKILHFIINIIISLIIVFSGCIYNEVLILYCCSFEKDTFPEITNRGINESVIDCEMNDDIDDLN